MDHLLSWIIWLPVIGMGVIAFIPRDKSSLIKQAAALVSGIQLLLAIYLFSTASFAGHCSAGASHDRDHDHDKEAKQSEMKEESSMKKDSEVDEAEAKEDKDTEA